MRVGLLLGCVQRVVFGTSTPRPRACSPPRAARSSRRAARAAAARCTSTPGALGGGPRAAPRGSPSSFARRGRDRRQRRRLRLAPEGARSCRVRVVDVNELLAELEPRAERQRAAAAGRLPGRLPPRPRAGDPRRAARGARARSRASSSSSRRSRRSAAGAPGSTTSSSRRRRASSASARRRTSSRPAPTLYASANPGLPRPGLDVPAEVGPAPAGAASRRAPRRVDPRRVAHELLAAARR